MGSKTRVYHCNLKITKKHLDENKHVNNAVYLELYEQARWDVLSQNGYQRSSLSEINMGPVVLDIFVVYKKELTENDKIKIETHYAGVKHRLALYIEQKILNENNQLVSSAKLTIGIMDLIKRKLIPHNEKWRKAMGDQ